MIFGELNSKMVSGVNTIDIPYSKIDPEFIISQYTMHRSIITGNLNFRSKGYLSKFKVRVHLFKYASITASYLEFESYKGSLVTFYPHKDKPPIKDIYGNEVKFLISDIEPFYLNNDYNIDIINILFVADRKSALISIAALGYGYGYGLDYGDQL